jgi:GNAT superfamily N-acetyltransferase
MGGVTPLNAPRPILQQDDASEFSCGDEIKDDWIRRFAIANHFGGGARVYVATRGARIAGFYTLSSASIQHKDATPRMSKAMPNPIPAVLLGRLAVDMKEAGQGLGTALVRDAVIRTVQAAEVVGIRVLLAHAASAEARRFYIDRGFDPSPTDPMHLVIILKAARARYAGASK